MNKPKKNNRSVLNENLYGTIDVNDLSRIVNNYLEVAIDEIEEDYMCAACIIKI